MARRSSHASASSWRQRPRPHAWPRPATTSHWRMRDAPGGRTLPRMTGTDMPQTTPSSDRFTALPGEQTLAATVVALEEHGSSVEVVDDLDAARDAVLARIPEGASV